MRRLYVMFGFILMLISALAAAYALRHGYPIHAVVLVVCTAVNGWSVCRLARS